MESCRTAFYGTALAYSCIASIWKICTMAGGVGLHLSSTCYCSELLSHSRRLFCFQWLSTRPGIPPWVMMAFIQAMPALINGLLALYLSRPTTCASITVSLRLLIFLVTMLPQIGSGLCGPNDYDGGLLLCWTCMVYRGRHGDSSCLVLMAIQTKKTSDGSLWPVL